MPLKMKTCLPNLFLDLILTHLIQKPKGSTYWFLHTPQKLMRVILSVLTLCTETSYTFLSLSLLLFYSFPMGTHSRIILRRSTGRNHIHLWMHWDGYFSGQGDQICKQLRLLLSKYSTISLQSMLDALEVPELEDDNQNFSAEHLGDFIEGHIPFKNDMCEDVEYEYTVDFAKGLLLASRNGEKTFVVTFASIQEGFNVSQIVEYLDE
jgi:hypothetical protein